MKEKIYVLIVTLLTLVATLIVPQNIHVKADGDYGDPGIKHEWIYNKTEDLSNIVFSYDRGRYFGTSGELDAAYLIEGCMNDIGLDCVHNETIDAYWNYLSDEYEVFPRNSLYSGNLSEARVMQNDYWINISYQAGPVTYYKNISGSDCYPYFTFKHPLYNGDEWVVSENNLIVYESFNFSDLRKQMELGNITWTDPYIVHDLRFPNYQGPPTLRYKGKIAVDNNTDTHFMSPPVYDQCFWFYWGTSPTFYVNQTIGKWIREALNKYEVKASFYTHWIKQNVTSYNIIGQINGTDPDHNNISIVCAHYDNMWNQGTIDEAAETALVLGIAKYIKDHELENNLKQTVKFIAFGGEEAGMRGSKDYIKKHVIDADENEKENITYVINPGNFGHSSRSGCYYNGTYFEIPLELNSDQYWLVDMAKNIADALQYTPRTEIDVIKNTDGLRAEDSQIFNKAEVSEACIQFGRGPFEGYHSDGEDHTKGDVLDILDNDTFNIESEVVTSVAMHLLLDPDFSFVNCSNSVFDKDGDGNNDSVELFFNLSSDTNTTLFGNVAGCLFNPAYQPGSVVNSTGLIPLKLGNTTFCSLNLTLLPDQPAGNYTALIGISDVKGNMLDFCNQTMYLEA